MVGPLILTVTQRGKPGIYTGKIEGTGLTVRATRHPLVDTARALLLVGASPDTVLKMRNLGSSVDRISGRIGVILKNRARKGPNPPILPFAERPEAKPRPRKGPPVRSPAEADEELTADRQASPEGLKRLGQSEPHNFNSLRCVKRDKPLR